MQFKVPKKLVSIISLIFSLLSFFSDSGSCIPVQNTQTSKSWNFSNILLNTLLASDSFLTSKGNECIVLQPEEDTLVELLSTGQVRSYSVLIIYEMNKAGNMEINKDHMTNRAERVKRLIYNNSAYNPSSTYKFHDGSIESITYEIDEDDPELKRANITFTCIVTEAI